MSCSCSHAAVDDGVELSLDLGKKKKKKKKDASADAGVGGLSRQSAGGGYVLSRLGLLLAWLEGWEIQWGSMCCCLMV